MPADEDTKPTKKRVSQAKQRVLDSEVEDSEPERRGGAEADVQSAKIEAILDASTNFLPNNKLGYLVKWKGFGPADNKWVGEDDHALEIASEMIEAFWGNKNGTKMGAKVSKRALEKGHASSTDDATVAPRKRGQPPLSKKSDEQPLEKEASSADDATVAPRKSKKSDEQHPEKIRTSNADDTTVAPRKRGRHPLSKKSEEEPPAKKVRKTGQTNAVASGSCTTPEDEDYGNMATHMHVPTWYQFIAQIDTVGTENDALFVYFTLHGGRRVRELATLIKFYERNLKHTDTMLLEEADTGNMTRHMHVPTWEGFIKEIETVDIEDDSLLVYFTLHGGRHVRELATVCAEKFPQTLIKFYESNLRFKVAVPC
ncbi:hypothetical protein C8R47DRAFT_1214237 [Mycena vitilis]|nr:hypothetical protein C8R47DRAFT_1214237 [Mycena vitilis]